MAGTCAGRLCLFAVFVSLVPPSIPQETCSAKPSGSSSTNCGSEAAELADERWQEYRQLVQDAEQSFSDTTAGDLSCFEAQIQKDLIPWQESGITSEMIAAAKRDGILYQVINGQLYRQRDCLFPARCEGIEYFLKKLVKNLTDTEFVVNVHDWPQVPKSHRVSGRIAAPVFSFSKPVDEYDDILYPAWSFFSGGPAIDLYPRGIGDWQKMRQTIVKKADDWNSKRKVAFFRGSRTSSERDGLVLISRSHPDLLDAQYTKNQAWRSLEDTLGEEPAETISFESQCKYKYLVNMKGVAASFRYKHLFLCKSLVLNVDSDWIEFFYPFLKPWIHFVPIATDFRDLLHKLHFLIENDSIAQRIAERGFHFIWNRLTIESVECYWNRLLSQYTKLLKYTVIADHSLIKINN